MPTKNPAYSPNLYKWMRARHNIIRAYVRLYREVSTGHLYLGYQDEDSWFYGAMLNRILTVGSRAWVGAMMPERRFEHVSGFWDEYLKLGRCAIDKDHETNFLGNRWEEGENDRVCLWCGREQTKKQKTVSRIVTYWA